MGKGERRSCLFLLALFMIIACSPNPRAPEPALAATPTSAPASQAASSPSTMPQSEPASEPASRAALDPKLKNFVQTGRASYYSDKLHGRKTSSGEPYDKRAFTCAHRSLPFGTHVRVENLANGKSVVVKVNDRGPHGGKRIIDVSRAAAEALDMIRSGTATVRLTIEEQAMGNGQ